jgi:hypothetical protein
MRSRIVILVGLVFASGNCVLTDRSSISLPPYIFTMTFLVAGMSWCEGD